MYSIDLEKIAYMCNGKLYGRNTQGDFNICFDTRQLNENEIFIALQGKTDGHNFIGNAIQKRAAALIVSKDIHTDIPYIKVDDTLKAFHLLAQNYRKYYCKDKTVIGITGTCGKTTSKEILSEFLKAKYKTAKNKANFNNHIGLPLTILNNPKQDTEILICEAGINKSGEMTLLSEILNPDLALITNIGIGHLEGFNDIDDYIREKAKILEKLSYDSFAVIPEESEPLLINYKKARFITFGYSRSADYQLEIKQMDLKKTIFSINNEIFETSLISKASIENICAAYAMAYELGIDSKALAHMIKYLKPFKNRMNIINKNNRTIIIDCYNANPVSFENALNILSGYTDEKISLIIGDMLELGKFSESEHIKLFEKIRRIDNCKDIVYIGEYAPLSETVLSDKNLKTYKKVEEFLINGFWKDVYQNNDVILIKASNSIGLGKFVEKLEAENVL